MTHPKSILLIVFGLLSSLVESIPIDNHPKDPILDKSLHDTEIPLSESESPVIPKELRVPESPVISQESPFTVQRSPGSPQTTPVNVEQESAAEIESKSSAQNIPDSPQNTPGIVQESTFGSPKDSDSSKGYFIKQRSASSSLDAGSQESKAAPIEDISENVLLRVKRQQRRRLPNNRNRNRGGGGSNTVPYGYPKRFCNQFGCDDDKEPARQVRLSKCPSGTRFDRKGNMCRRLSGGGNVRFDWVRG